ncbi:MAG: tetratricopeptide repeat protein [Promethearchaeota archaeon]|jgi:tetratricopeptide (TPR) repeat protein
MPDSFLEELNRANALMREGNFQGALEITNKLEKKITLPPGDQLTILILKGKIYSLFQQYAVSIKIGKLSYRLSQALGRTDDSIYSLLFKANCVYLGQTDKALDYLLEAEDLLDSLSDISPSHFSRQRANILFRRAWANYIKGNFNTAIETALECLSLHEKLGRRTDIAYSLTLIGDCYFMKADYNNAFDYAMKGKNLFEELGDKIGLTTSLRVLGTIYFGMGNIDQALKYSKKSYSSMIGTPQNKIDALVWITNIYTMKGELDKSLRYLNQGIALSQKEGYNNHYMLFQINTGSIYIMKRDFDLAIEYLKTGSMLAEKMGNDTQLCLALIYLILVNIEKNALEEAQEYLNQLKKLRNENESKLLNHGYLLAKAYFLKCKSGSRIRAKAERLLKQVAQDESYPPIKMNSLIYLCEFYLEEVTFFEDIDLIKEFNPILIQLLKISEEQKMYGTLAEAKLLQAKLSLIQMNLEEAQRLLTQAQRVAELYGLNLIAQKISIEHDNYLEKLGEWESFKERDAPVSERLKLASVDKVLERLQGKRALEPPELLEEEPIVLLIIDKSGISYFNYSFKEGWDFDWLFSSFMSAFETFSSEVFSESIDRIKIGENLILINPVESFLVCYIIKGQSYPGLQKLNRFSKAIKDDNEIWETLSRAVKTGEVLELNKPGSLGIIVKEIFEQGQVDYSP